MTKKVLLSVGLVLVGSLFLALSLPGPSFAAAAKGPAASAPSTPKAEFNWKMRTGEKLRVAMVTQPWSEFINKYIPEFKALTGIDVTYEILPEDQFRQKTTVEFAAGTSDVDAFLSMVAQEGIKYESAGWYADIEALLKDQKITDPNFDFKDFTRSGLGIAKLPNGKQIGLPVYNEFGAIFYNKELFDKAGVKYPPKTIEDVEKAAAAINKSSEGIYGFVGRGRGAAATSQFSSVMYSFGSAWTTPAGKANITDPKFLNAVKWYGNMLNKYGPPGTTSYSWQQAQDVFIQGKVGMWLDASVFFANAVDPSKSKVADKVGITMAPQGPGGRTPYVGGWHLSIYNASKHKEAAWLFVQWALSKAMVLKAQLNSITTSRVSAWESADYKKANKYPELATTFLEAMKVGNAQWNPPVLGVSEARDAIGVVLIKAIEGGDFTSEAAKANQKLQELLDATPKLK
jgi:multiple sugar transport system substrate-binding protein